MDDVGLGRTLRALRLRSKLSQAAAARKAGVSQASWSRIERGHVAEVTVAILRRTFGSVDARLDLTPTWRGGAVERLRDQRHSAVVAAIVALLASLGWQTAVEVTYSEFGERGSIDVLAVHPQRRLALIVEVKTEIASQEQMVRRIDEKTRLAPKIVHDRFGWRPTAVSRLLVLESTMTNRRHVAALAPILDGAFPLRSDQARAWLRSPTGSISGLIFVSPIRPRTQREPGRPSLVSGTRRVDA
jgi:transcriptional regulator with XRE-family HTH domain